MKILDTTFLIDMIRGKKETIPIINSTQHLFTTQINMYEVIRGFFLENIAPSNFYKIIELFENIKLLNLDDNSIIKSAEISSNLTKKGKYIPHNDCLIAGIAIAKGITTIITKDSEHFKRIKEINIERY